MKRSLFTAIPIVLLLTTVTKTYAAETVALYDTYPYAEQSEQDAALESVIAAARSETDQWFFTADAETFAAVSDIPYELVNGRIAVDPDDVKQILADFYLRNGYELADYKLPGVVAAPDSDLLLSFTLAPAPDLDIRNTGTIEAAAKAVIEAAGITETTSKHDAAIALNAAVEDYFEYDEIYTGADMKTALQSGHGVCRHYAKLYEYACRMCGIDCITVYGYVYGDPRARHAWNRLIIDGEPLYNDVTWNDECDDDPCLLRTGYPDTHTIEPYYMH